MKIDMDKNKEQFIKRLTELRISKGVSARDMSLSIGQSPGYINNIENGVNLPSMSIFFYICEYLNVTPCDFFNYNTQDPIKTSELMSLTKQLNRNQIAHITDIIKDIVTK